MDDIAGQDSCRTILDSVPTLIVAADREGIIQLINRDAFGHSREEIIGRSIYEFIGEEFQDILREKVAHVFENKDQAQFVFHEPSEMGEQWFRLRLGPAIVNDEVNLVILTNNNITDQKSAENLLRDSEAKLRGLFNTTLEGIMLTDETGSIVEWNQAQEDIFGVKREDVLGKKLWDVQDDLLPSEAKTQDRYEQLKESMLTYFETGQAHWLGQISETEVLMSSGQMGIIQHFSAPIRTSKGYSLCAFIHDVTNRRRAEQERAVSEKRYRALFEENNDAVTILDLEGRHLDFNKRFEELLGYSKEELISVTTELTVAEEETQDSKQRLNELLEGKTLPIYERNLQRKDGTQVPVEINISLIRDEENNPLHIQSIIRDISSRKASKHALEKSEEKYRTLVENMQDGIVILQEGRVVFSNNALASLAGYSVEEVQGRLVTDFIAKEDRQFLADRYQRRLAGEEVPPEYEIQGLHKKGHTIPIRIRGHIIEYQGKPSTIATITDISEQKIAEEAVREERDRAEMYLDMAGVIFLALDTEGRITLLNKKGTEVLKYPHEEIIGKSWFDIIPQRVREDVRTAFGELIKGEIERIENVERSVLTKAGEERLIIWNTTCLKDASGKTIGTISSGEDITEKRAAQLELKASQDMLQLVMNNIPQHVFWKDLASNYIGCNDSFAEVYVGGTPADVIGKSDYDIQINPVEADKFREADNVALESKDGRYDTIERTYLPNGDEAWFRTIKVPLHDGSGSTIGVLGTLEDVTEKRKADLELVEAYNIINMSPTVTFLWRNVENWPVEFTSRNVRDIFGYTKDEFLSGSILYSTVVHPDDLESVVDEVAGFSTDALCVSFTHEPYRIIRKDGEVRWITDDTVIRRNEKGEITHYQGVVTDITDRVLVEEALRESESKYRSVVEQSLMGLVIIDSEDRTIRFANPLIARYLGLTVADLHSMSIEDLVDIIDPEDLASSTRFLEECIRGGAPSEIAVGIIRQSGERIWALLDGSSIIFEGRNAVQLSIVDITERYEATEALRRERASFQAIAESTIRASDTTDLSRRLVAGLVEALDFDFGTLRLYDEKENVLRPTAIVGVGRGKLADRVECTEEEEKNLLVVRTARSKKPIFASDVTEHEITRNHLHRLDVLNVKSLIIIPILNEREDLLGVMSLAGYSKKNLSSGDPGLFKIINELLVTILERGKTEHAYQMSVRRYRDLLTNMEEGIGVISLDEKFIFVNESFANMLGYSTSDLVGTDSISIIHPEDLPRIRGETELRRKGISSAYQVRVVRRDGDVRNVRISAIPSRDDEGIVEGTVAIVTDITERMKAEQEVLQLNRELAQRVEERTAELRAVNKELEAFAYSVSHDLRAPLRSIDGFSQAVLEDYADSVDDTGKDYLQRIRLGATNMSKLIDDVLGLSRVTRADMERIDVNLSKLGEEAILDLREAEPDRKVKTIINSQISARCDKRLMRIVLQNLLGNAWKFTRLTDDAMIELGVQHIDGEMVYFVRDNGVGFDKGQNEKLFKPFQRLHKADEFEGSGIGLATVQRVIDRHGGRIWAESQMDKGTIFYFTLKTAKEVAKIE